MIHFKASFDDGCQLDLKVAELMEKYGFKDVIFYIPSQWHDVNRLHGDVPLTEDEVRELSKKYKIGSHTVTHPMLTRITKGEAFNEIFNSKQQLEEMFDIEIEDFCYPRGYANDGIRDIVRKMYKTGRNTLVGNLLPSEDPIWETPTVHVSGKRRKEYESTTWLMEGRRLLQEASSSQPDTVFHIWGHSWEIDRYNDWEDFETFLSEMQYVAREQRNTEASQ